MLFRALLFFAVAFSQAASASPVRIATLECAFNASAKHQVPTNVLLAVLSLENGKEGHSNSNKDRTKDHGRSQINDVSIPELMQDSSNRDEFARVKSAVINDGCYAVEASAYLIRKRTRQPPLNQDYWTRVARYHSRTPSANAEYRKKLIPMAARWERWLIENYQAVTFDVGLLK